MREHFPSYYYPKEDELKALWETATVVVDTNIICALYRLKKTASDELLAVLKALKDRLWIPHQVALEYQENRLSILASYSELLTKAGQQIGNCRAACEELKALRERHIGFDPGELINGLESFLAKASDWKAAADKTKPSVYDDEFRPIIDELFGDRIGPAPKNQAALNAMLLDAESRYASKIPPGFGDLARKEKLPDVRFMDMLFPRKYGDLILWRQILEHCKESQNPLLVITNDNKKGDWFHDVEGQRIGPHRDLIEEVYTKTSVTCFWMYDLGKFLEDAKVRLRVKVSDESINEARELGPTNNPGEIIRNQIGEAAELHQLFERARRAINAYENYAKRPDYDEEKLLRMRTGVAQRLYELRYIVLKMYPKLAPSLEVLQHIVLHKEEDPPSIVQGCRQGVKMLSNVRQAIFFPQLDPFGLYNVPIEAPGGIPGEDSKEDPPRA